MAAPFDIPIGSVRFNFLYISTNPCCFLVWGFVASFVGVVVSHGGFDCISTWFTPLPCGGTGLSIGDLENTAKALLW